MLTQTRNFFFLEKIEPCKPQTNNFEVLFEPKTKTKHPNQTRRQISGSLDRSQPQKLQRLAQQPRGQRYHLCLLPLD